VIGAVKTLRESELSSNRPTPKWSRSGSGEGSGVEHAGIICTGETYKAVVKMTFAKGASLRTLQPLQLQPRRQHQARHRFPARATRLMKRR
jgi:hypothetical protein